jgi:glycogen synthase
MALCLLCSCIPGKRVFLTFHSGGYSSTDEAKAARPATIRGFVLRQLEGLIAVNQDIAAVFLRYGASPNRVHVISPWVSPSTVPRVSIPEDLQQFMNAHSPLLTTVGLLEQEYDLAFQIDALEKVRERWPRAGLMVVGSGSLEEGLRRQIRSKSYADHVRLCGDVPRPITLRLIESSNIFLRTTLYDGDALSVREALHLGVATIATDNGMRPDGVILIPVADSAALIEAISSALVSPRPKPPANRDGVPPENFDAVLDLYQARH